MEKILVNLRWRLKPHPTCRNTALENCTISSREPAPRVIPAWHKTGREKSLFCSSLELQGCTSTWAAATSRLSPQSLSTHILTVLHFTLQRLFGEKTLRIFLLFSTQTAAQSLRVKMKTKIPLQKVTQDNILQPSSHVLSVQSFSEVPTLHPKCCCYTNQSAKGHLMPSYHSPDPWAGCQRNSKGAD